jgi:hypothetical protein
MQNTRLNPARITALFAVSVLLAGCPAPVTHYTDPGEFARTIFRVARKGDVREWSTLLTKERREMGAQYASNHLAKYQRLLLELEEGPLGGNLARAEFRVNDNALEFQAEGKWHTFFRVSMEDGGWKINQD